MTPVQCRQGRELLGWHQQRLALQANSCLSSVVGFEAGEKVTRPTTVSAFRAALKAAGVEFIAEVKGGAGVRLAFGPGRQVYKAKAIPEEMIGSSSK